jgi:thiamine biosynthesis lipoprotein
MIRYFFFCLILLLFACKEPTASSNKTVSYTTIKGITMGVVSYTMKYKDVLNRPLQARIDSLLNNLNMGSSNYEKESTISFFNQSEKGIDVEPVGHAQHFINNLVVAKEVFEKTNGYFDPTVDPLMKYYGFREKEGIETIDTAKIMDLLTIIGFDKISIEKKNNNYFIGKPDSTIRLDFSAIAKGYAIDEVGRFLESLNIQDYLIEIGGEFRAKGLSPRGNPWNIAIRKPSPDAAEGRFMEALPLVNRSMATSGNYENFRLIEGKKMGHTMNPKTGFPELNALLSVTVFADDCIIADSYATAFMAMGLEKSFNLAQQLPEIETYLVFVDENGTINTKYTSGLETLINH